MLTAKTAWAQYPTQKVLVEAGTGVWCASCPTAVQMIDMLHEDGANIAVVKYHSAEGHEDPFETETGLERIHYYDVTFFPSLFVDGVRVEPWNGYQNMVELYDNAVAEERNFRISLTGKWLGDDRIFLSATTEKSTEARATDIRLYVAITESSIPHEWHGETQVDFAQRFLWPDGEGFTLEFNGETQLNHHFEAELDRGWNRNNLEFVAFLQENESKQILQATQFSAQQVGIAEQSAETFNIYPNPASDFIYIEGPNVFTEIKLYTLQGHLVYATEKATQKIDVRNHSPGLYVLKAKAGNRPVIRKIRIR